MTELQSGIRTRVACKVCNARRVKCDRSFSGIPCSNCRRANTVCELIDSRRGKHKRVSNKHQQSPRRTSFQVPESNFEASSSTTPITSASEQNDDASEPRQRYVSPSLPEFAIRTDSSNTEARVVYMGDSGNMKYVLDEVGDPFRNNTSQPMVWGENLQNHMIEELGPTTNATIRNFRFQDDQHLRQLGALDFPTKRLADDLLTTFLKYSYPVFPLFDRTEFVASHEAGRLSPLVQNAVYLVAAIHCPQSMLEELGYESRYLACLTFYQRAKALYDADHDTDGISTVQATILLGNWWGGPMEQKDTWHWLGLAAGLAQALGMHRSKTYSVLPALQKSLWRRIWWVLYMNDVHHAAVFGRPPHIHQDYCDIDPLTEADFPDYVDDTADSMDESKLYLIHLSNLAYRVGRCLVAKFSPVHSEVVEHKRYQELVQFEKSLEPRFLDTPARITLERGYWPSLIHLYHCDYQIVFHRMLSALPDSNITFVAATKISRILENLLASGMLYSAPFMALPAVFASLLVHIIHMRKSDVHISMIAENRVRLGMHILENLGKVWPIAIWTGHLLDVLFKQSCSASIRQRHPTSSTQLPEIAGRGSRMHPTRNHQHDLDENTTQELNSPQTNSSTLAYPESRYNQQNLSSQQRRPQQRSFHPDDPEHIASLEALFSEIPLIYPFDDLLEDAGLSPNYWSTMRPHSMDDYL